MFKKIRNGFLKASYIEYNINPALYENKAAKETDDFEYFSHTISSFVIAKIPLSILLEEDTAR